MCSGPLARHLRMWGPESHTLDDGGSGGSVNVVPEEEKTFYPDIAGTFSHT